MSDNQLFLLLDFFSTEQRIRREKCLLILISLAFAMDILAYKTATVLLILGCFSLISYILFREFSSLHATIEELKRTTSQYGLQKGCFQENPFDTCLNRFESEHFKLAEANRWLIDIQPNLWICRDASTRKQSDFQRIRTLRYCRRRAKF